MLFERSFSPHEKSCGDAVAEISTYFAVINESEFRGRLRAFLRKDLTSSFSAIGIATWCRASESSLKSREAHTAL